MENIGNLYKFLDKVNDLKYVYRFSLSEDMPKESTAAHCWRLSLMSLLISKEFNVDKEHVLKLAIVHDLAESITGDIDYRLVAADIISKKEKSEQEKKAMKELKQIYSDDEIYELWIEYEEGKTQEVKFLKALDKIEALLHITKMGFRYFSEPDHLIKAADKSVKNFPGLMAHLGKIKERFRNECKKGNIEWKKEYNFGLE